MSDYDDERKTERFWLRCGPTFKADIERAAKADRRDVAEWARLQLEQRLMESKQKPGGKS
jgi:hypothetical protein